MHKTNLLTLSLKQQKKGNKFLKNGIVNFLKKNLTPVDQLPITKNRHK